jgi:hypothetical protein
MRHDITAGESVTRHSFVLLVVAGQRHLYPSGRVGSENPELRRMKFGSRRSRRSGASVSIFSIVV